MTEGTLRTEKFSKSKFRFYKFSKFPPIFPHFEYFAKSPKFSQRKSANPDFQKFREKVMSFNPRFKLPNKKGGFFKMKKIITAAAVAALAASFAAAEVTVKMNARVQANAFSTQKDAAGNKATTYMDLAGYGDAKDDGLILDAKTDNAGAHLELAVNGGSAKATNANSISVDSKYSAWVKWGNLKITGGKFDSRYSDRVNNTATESGLTDGSTAKFGISSKLAGIKLSSVRKAKNPGKLKTTTIDWEDEEETVDYATYGSGYGVDFNNITASGGTRLLSMVADYTLAGVLPGKLNFAAGLTAQAYDSDETDTDDLKYTYAGSSYRITYAQDKLLNAEVLFRNPERDVIGFGTYVKPAIAEKLTVVGGFTFLKNNNSDTVKTTFTNGNDAGTLQYRDGTYSLSEATTAKETTTYTFNKYTAFAVDGRFAYQFADPLLATLQVKYSQLKYDILDDPIKSLEFVSEVSYKVNDILTVALDGGLYLEGLSNEDVFGEKNLGNNTFAVSPRVKITASPNCAITAGLEYTKSFNTDDKIVVNSKAVSPASKYATDYSIKVPVVLRVKF